MPSNDLDNGSFIIKCRETTGTDRSDIFSIKKPSFQWYYKGIWYELADSNEGVAKDWEVNFKRDTITLYNNKTDWNRFIDLKRMIASMKFSSNEEYLYVCNKIKVGDL